MGDPYLGEIRMTSFPFPPKGWAFCNGQTLPINQNQALYSILGTTYGGDGQTNFRLPDLRGRVPVHAFGSSIPLGQAGGEEMHQLNVGEMPAHTHVVQANSGTATSPSPQGNVWAGTSGYTAQANGQMLSAAISPQGGGKPHENRQPYSVVNFIIAVRGIYPTPS